MTTASEGGLTSRFMSPPRGQLARLATPLNPGELRFLEFLEAHLSSDWEIYVQPHMNNLRPDFVLLHPKVGVAVYEPQAAALPLAADEARTALGSRRQMSDPIANVLPSVARALALRTEAAGGPAALGEVRDLEPEMVDALTTMLPHLVVEKNRRIPIPHWGTVGNVDIVCRQQLSDPPLLAVELKWSRGDKVYEAIWDLFKMALLATEPRIEATYLVTGAPEKEWQRGVGSEIFTDAVHRVTDLCALRFTKRCGWDYLLEGGYDRYPLQVPAEIRTELVAEESTADGWALRAVRVYPVGTDVVPFTGGWPFGERPADAKHPRLVDSPTVP